MTTTPPEPTPVPVASTAAPVPPAPTSVPEEKKIRVGMVSDVGGIDDASFNENTWKGLQDASDQLGEAPFLEWQAQADHEPNIIEFAEQGYDMIVTVAFCWAMPPTRWPRSTPTSSSPLWTALPVRISTGRASCSTSMTHPSPSATWPRPWPTDWTLREPCSGPPLREFWPLMAAYDTKEAPKLASAAPLPARNSTLARENPAWFLLHAYSTRKTVTCQMRLCCGRQHDALAQIHGMGYNMIISSCPLLCSSMAG